MGKLCAVGEGVRVLVQEELTEATRCRGSWESIDNEGCSSSCFFSGSRRNAGHRRRAASGRGTHVLQTGHQMQDEEEKRCSVTLTLDLLQSGLAASLSSLPSLLPALSLTWEAQLLHWGCIT